MAEAKLTLSKADVRHLVVVGVASILILTAIFAPWWTRGYTAERAEPLTDEGDDFPFFLETFTVSYGPFSTPSFGPFEFDSVREAAVIITGVAVSLAALLCLAHNLVRWGIRAGRVDVDPGVPVKLAISAAIIGIFGVMFALLWPFMGLSHDGIGYSSEELFSTENASGDTVYLVEAQEYLNVGFYLGILAFVAYPMYLWADASWVRLAEEERQAQAAAAPAKKGKGASA